MEQLIGSFFSIVFGLACFAGAIVHERKWRHIIRNWKRTTGIVTAEIDGDETSSPEIEYEDNGKSIRFVSQYGGGAVKPGESVVVMFDPETNQAEQLKWANRWLPLIALITFGSTFVGVGLLSW